MQTLRNLGPTRLAVLGAVLVVAAVFFGFLITQGGGEQKALYSNLDPIEAGQIAQHLDAQGIPYTLEENGTAIMVASDRIPAIRMEMAGQGLPTTGSVGYEIFDNQDTLGTTNFVQRVNQIRALEGELSRTIRTMQAVRNARVHIVLPQRELFSRENREPSASVQLQLTSRSKLQPEQVVAIQQLVAAAVPDLTPNRIAVIDDLGNVYSRGKDDGEGFAAINADQLRSGFETDLASRIEEIVGRAIGLENVRATVSADINFNRATINSERYNPDEQVARSVQTVEENAEQTETTGEDPVSVAQQLPDAQTQFSTGAGSFSRSSRNEETTNFEISRTTTTEIRETGDVERMSVAVLVNGSYAKDTQGNLLRGTDGNYIYTPRTQQEMQNIRQIVESAVAVYDADVQVVNMPFDQPLFEDPTEELLFGLFRKDEVKDIAGVVGLLIMAILVMLLIVRPMIARALESSQEEAGVPGGIPGLPERPGGPALAGPDLARRLDESAEMEALEQMIDINQVEGRVRASSLRKIGEIIDKHPEEAVAILRNWMYQES